MTEPSMKVIYKYKLSISEPTHILLPEGAAPLTVAVQGDQICLWVEQDDPVQEGPYVAERRTFVIRGTGWKYDKNKVLDNYIGTAFIAGFVWHVFEVGDSYA